MAIVTTFRYGLRTLRIPRLDAGQPWPVDPDEPWNDSARFLTGPQPVHLNDMGPSSVTAKCSTASHAVGRVARIGRIA